MESAADTVELAPPRADVLLPTGTTIDRYILVDVLGVGGMGVVYSAYDAQLDRKVAIKVLRAPTSAGADDIGARLLREAQAMARLQHPNVVAVHDVGTYEASVFLAMEYVDGGTLKDWLKGQPSLAARLAALKAAGRGLAAAHHAGLVHRDFKPDNVLVGKDGRVRVTDFGIARADETMPPTRPSVRAGTGDALDATASSSPSRVSVASTGGRMLDSALTVSGSILGTVGYMAPEQAFGEKADTRSDQFSFCVTLFLALHGRRPFAASSLNEYLAALGQPVEPPRDTGVPGWLQRVVLRGLRERPEERFPSMDALLDELDKDPAVLRRRALVALAFFAAAVLIAVAWGRPRATPVQTLCAHAEAKLDGVWDVPRRAQLAAVFAAEKKSTDAGKSVASALDDYTKRWTEMRTDACLATRVRGEQSDELLDLRMQCLDERLREVGSLVDEIAKGDADVVGRAPQAARSLTLLSSCADVAALTAPVRAPTDPETKARVEAVRGLVARGTSESLLGLYAQARTAADEAARAAEITGYKPVQAAALRLLGESLLWLGKYKEAREALVQAEAAAIVGKESIVTTRALALLVLSDTRESRFESAHVWAQLGAAAATHAGLVEQGELSDAIGQLLFAERKFPEAKLEVQSAIAAWEKALGGDDIRLADPLTDLANIDLALGRYADAKANNLRAIAVVEKVAGESPLIASNVNNLGDACLKASDFACAAAAFERAHDIYEKAYGHDFIATAVTLSNLGEVWRLKGEPDRALPPILEAIAILHKLYEDGGPYIGAVLDGLAETYRAKGSYRRAIETFDQALLAREKALGPSHPDLAETLTGMGETWLDAEQSARARPPLARALALREANAGDPYDVGETRFALARATQPVDPTRARALALKARSELAEAGPHGEAKGKQVDAWLHRAGQ